MLITNCIQVFYTCMTIITNVINFIQLNTVYIVLYGQVYSWLYNFNETY